jgi:hypothetical protein
MNGYRTTGRFWLVFILTICVLCAVGCGGSDEPLPEPESECTLRPTPQFVGPVLSCAQTV